MLLRHGRPAPLDGVSQGLRAYVAGKSRDDAEIEQQRQKVRELRKPPRCPWSRARGVIEMSLESGGREVPPSTRDFFGPGSSTAMSNHIFPVPLLPVEQIDKSFSRGVRQRRAGTASFDSAK